MASFPADIQVLFYIHVQAGAMGTRGWRGEQGEE